CLQPLALSKSVARVSTDRNARFSACFSAELSISESTYVPRKSRRLRTVRSARQVYARCYAVSREGRAHALQLRCVRQRRRHGVERRQKAAGAEAPAQHSEGRSGLLLPHG